MKRSMITFCVMLTFGSIAAASGHFVSITPENVSKVGRELTLVESSQHSTKDMMGVKLSYSSDPKSLEDLFATKLHVSNGTQSIAVTPLGVKKDKTGMMSCIFRISRKHIKHSMVVLSYGKEGLKEIHYQMNIGVFVETALKLGHVVLSKISNKIHHGKPILIKIAVTNHHDEPITVPVSQDLTLWLVKSSLGLKLKKDKKPIPRRPDPNRFKKVRTTTVNPGKNFTFTIDLRSVFEFPVKETGNYQLISGDTSSPFKIEKLPNMVISTLVFKGKHRDSQNVEYAVVQSGDKKGSCELLARKFNGVFKKIYTLKFAPTAMFARQIEDASGSATGCLLALSSEENLYILTPGQAYYGNVNGDRGTITHTEINHLVGIEAMSIARNGKENATDIRIKISILEPQNKKQQKTVFFRLHKHKMTGISEEVFLISKLSEEEGKLQREQDKIAEMRAIQEEQRAKSGKGLTKEELERLRQKLLRKLERNN